MCRAMEEMRNETAEHTAFKTNVEAIVKIMIHLVFLLHKSRFAAFFGSMLPHHKAKYKNSHSRKPL